MTTTEVQAHSDEALLAAIAFSRSVVDLERRSLDELEQEALRRMMKRGAMAIPSERFLCELQTRDTYDPAVFAPLKEVFSAVDLKEVFTPEHQELITVKERWETIKVKAKAKRYGNEALAIVERARIVGRPTLKFSER